MNRNALSSIKGVVGSNGKKMPNTPNPNDTMPNITNKALIAGLFAFLALFNSKLVPVKTYAMQR